MHVVDRIIKFFSRGKRKELEVQSAGTNITDKNESDNKENNQEKLVEPCEHFSKSVLCFQLKRDIDQMLDLRWMTENYGPKEEELSLSKMQVRNMSEFLEKISKDDDANSEDPEGAKQSRIRRYELVDKQQAKKLR